MLSIPSLSHSRKSRHLTFTSSSSSSLLPVEGQTEQMPSSSSSCVVRRRRASSSVRLYELASRAGVPCGLAYEIGENHREVYNSYTPGPGQPTRSNAPGPGKYNAALGLFTVAWFKLHAIGESYGVSWADLVSGRGPSSLCGGGDGAMERCEVANLEAATS